MKAPDIQKLRDDGLISAEQCGAIIERYHLERGQNRFVHILAYVGVVLVCGGVIQIAAANWDEIPKAVKLAMGAALLVGAHAAGWMIGRGGRRPVASSVLHLLGSGLFLANIGLAGQIYNLGSNPANGFFLWLVGIAPLPWILRSKSQYVLTLGALGLWLGFEIDNLDSWFGWGAIERIFILYTFLGVLMVAAGSVLRRGLFGQFAGATEKFGLLTVYIASFPLTLDFFYNQGGVRVGALVLCGLLTVAIVGLLALSVARDREGMGLQWAMTWAVTLIGLVGLGWIGLLVNPSGTEWWLEPRPGWHWVAIPALFAFALVQAKVGEIRRSPFLINSAIGLLGAQFVNAYCQLFGTMFATGLVFAVGGILLILLAVFLEQQRRRLLRNARESTPPSTPAFPTV